MFQKTLKWVAPKFLRRLIPPQLKWAVRLYKKPRALRPAVWLLTRILRRVLRGLAWSKIFNVTVIGRENVPAKGRVIVASNHRSVSDPVFLWGALRRNATAIAMAELWRVPVVNLLMWSMAHIPIKRGNKESGQKATAAGIRILKHDGLLIIYPEGGCSKDGELRDFFPGYINMAYATGSPVVPTSIKGSENVKPLGSKRINRKEPVVLRFGEPVWPTEYDSEDEFNLAVRERILLQLHTP